MKFNKFKWQSWSLFSIIILAVLFGGFGCGPAKVLGIKEIKPNETAWAIPLDGASQGGQIKFNSVQFLDQKKVASKRIMVDMVSRSTGRLWFDYEWIPAIKVITVDRSLITREWTDASNTGTSAGRQGVGVVTKDSVQLRVGLTVTASIDEDDASTYLYYHGEKTLAVAELTRKYGDMSLQEAQTKGTEIYAELFADAKTAFKAKGITIQYLGNAEGLTYSDPKVQEAINKSYQSTQDAKTAQADQAAQQIRNQTTIMTRLAEAQAEAQAQQVRNDLKIKTSEAEAQAARNLLAAKEAALFQNELTINLTLAQAKMAMAQKWNGSMPTSILPSNSPLLMNLGTTDAESKSQATASPASK